MTTEQYPGIHTKEYSYQATYSEKQIVGYRWYDKHGVKPAFPFGHGLTYGGMTYVAHFSALSTCIKESWSGFFFMCHVLCLYYLDILGSTSKGGRSLLRSSVLVVTLHNSTSAILRHQPIRTSRRRCLGILRKCAAPESAIHLLVSDDASVLIFWCRWLS